MFDYKNLSLEEIETQIDQMSDSDLDLIINPPKTAKVSRLPKLSFPKVPSVKGLRLPHVYEVVSILMMVGGLSPMFLFFMIPAIQNQPAHSWAERQELPTKVEFCWASDFQGRICYFKNQKGETFARPIKELK